MPSSKRPASDDANIQIERVARQKLAELRRAQSPFVRSLPCMEWIKHCPSRHKHWDYWDVCDDVWPEELEPVGLDETCAETRQLFELSAFAAADRDPPERRILNVEKRDKAAHQTVKWARDQIAHEMTSTLRRVDELHRLIQSQNLTLVPRATTDRTEEQIPDDEFFDGTKRTAWYWKGNLLALNLQYVEAMLDSRPIENPEDFREYIARIVRDSYASSGLIWRHGDDLVHKTLVLYEALEACPAPNTENQVFILCVDLTIWLAEQDSDDRRRARVCEDLATALLDLSHYLCVSETSKTYSEFAAMRRRVWSHWRDDLTCHMPSNAYNNRQCFHERVLYVLSLLQQATYQDAKTKTYIAVEEHLPAELADLIVETILNAEEVPMHPDIYDNTGDLRPEYRCARIKSTGKIQRGPDPLEQMRLEFVQATQSNGLVPIN